MAREDVEALRRGYEALGRRELEAALSVLDPEVRVEDHEWSLGSPTTRHGHAGFLEIFTSVNEGSRTCGTRPRSSRTWVTRCW